jgi:lipoprotein signal peptidase
MRRIAIILSLILVLIYIDFLSKQYVQDILAGRVHEYFPIIGEYLGISLSYNAGIAFSLPITGIPLQIITLLLVF